jgi:hypothetical protein
MKLIYIFLFLVIVAVTYTYSSPVPEGPNAAALAEPKKTARNKAPLKNGRAALRNGRKKNPKLRNKKAHRLRAGRKAPKKVRK